MGASAFHKMNGLGNAFAILDLRGGRPRLAPQEAATIAATEGGVGADQVISLEDPSAPGAADVRMGIWNADGGEVEACGNAARCVAWLLMEERGEDKASIEAGGQTLLAERAGAKRVTVDMGRPRLSWDEIPLAEPMDTRRIDIKLGPIDAPYLWGPAAVSMGNPHCVFFVDAVEDHKLERFGPLVENHPLFPERTNVELAEVRSEDSIRLRVWERGVGITQACGTGACATLVAAHRRGLAGREADIILDGGVLRIAWDANDRVIMTGDIAYEYAGEWTGLGVGLGAGANGG
ncbi:MAG: diaminopimelate epimerase [Pseudomonadota bacterium]